MALTIGVTSSKVRKEEIQLVRRVLSVEPAGGLGNRLFTIHFAMQVAYQIGADWNTPRGSLVEEASWCKAKPSSSLTIRERLLPARTLRAPDLPTEFNSVQTQLEKAFSEVTQVKLRGPILGERFFDSCQVDPRFFLEPSFYNQPSTDVPYVAVHFRGGDFHAWNPRAILPYEYYESSIEWALSSLGPGTPVALVTDDPELETYQRVRRLLGPDAIMEQERSVLGDFSVLGNSAILISSPSTFCIWAGILGTPEVVHSSDWVVARAEAEDRFWVKLLEGGNDFYRARVFSG